MVLTYFIGWQNNAKSSQNNQSTWCLPPKYERDIFQKKTFHGWWGTNIFCELVGRELFYMRGLIIRSMPIGEWGHSLHLQPPPPPFSAEGIEPPTKYSKKGLERVSIFRGMLLGKRGWPCSRRGHGLQFLHKNKLKSEIFTM